MSISPDNFYAAVRRCAAFAPRIPLGVRRARPAVSNNRIAKLLVPVGGFFQSSAGDAFFEAASRYLRGFRREDLTPDQAGIRL